ncbi:alpha/beta hydrolase [Egbenema bharatensis]|uniref:alpha/beta hydrolase n=1 Tax=Egbenema bharatensis TaxID=3463334 RepID=UPI003A8A8319
MTTIYFATNRNPLPPEAPTDFGSSFSADGLANLRFGKAEVSPNANTPPQITVAPENLFQDPPLLGSEIIFEEVRQEMQQQAEDTLIFIHGFNTPFHSALRQAAQIHQILTQPDVLNPEPLRLNMCVFSWPSDGSLLLTNPRAQDVVAYRNDRLDAAASGAAFARGFLKVADFIDSCRGEACLQRLHLLTHSMGTYVLRNALQEVRLFVPNRLPRIFDQILLIASDEDDDAFDYDHKLRLLPRITRHTSIYFNRNDLALWASDRIKGNPARLGTDGPLQPLQLPRHVFPIDCTDVVSRRNDPTSHSYHLNVERVAIDLRQVLRGQLADEIPGRRYVQDSNTYRLLPNVTP